MSDIAVREVRQIDDKVLAAINALLPQLSSSATPLDFDQARSFVEHEANSLLFAENGAGDVLGMLTLVVFPLPTGVRAWIEDVVVDDNARGQGIGELLSVRALERARELGARTVDLTSRPSREAANRLYQRVGFTPRETNVYRYDLSN